MVYDGDRHHEKTHHEFNLDASLLSPPLAPVFVENIINFNCLKCLWPVTVDLRVNGRRPVSADLSAKGLKHKMLICYLGQKIEMPIKDPNSPPQVPLEELYA